MNITKVLREIGETKKTVVGEDVNLVTCINEGYYLCSKKEGGYYRIMQFLPNYCISEGANFGLIVDIEYSLEDLLERYEQHKIGIDKFVGMEYSLNPEDYKDIHSVLSLAGSIAPYCGLD